MKFLIDTNVTLRLLQPTHAMHAAAVAGVTSLLKQGHELLIVPQVLYEFWVVCTRPTADNGLGLSTVQAASEIEKVLAQFTLIEDNASIFPVWRHFVTSLGVAGKGAHDARLVAAMNIHGIANILTFNVAEFQRYLLITAVSPDQLAQTISPTK